MTRSDTSHRPLARLTCTYCLLVACYLLTRSPRRAIKAAVCFLLNRSSHRVIKAAQQSRKEKGESVHHVKLFSLCQVNFQSIRVFISLLQKKIHPGRWATAARRTYQHVRLSTRKKTGAHVALSRTPASEPENTQKSL
jgi:hypothetical protein